MRYTVLKGAEAWISLTDEQRLEAEVKVGDNWLSGCGNEISIGGHTLAKFEFVRRGCEFRIPEPQEWIIERAVEDWNYIIDGTESKSLASVLHPFPVGTKFKLTVMEEGK